MRCQRATLDFDPGCRREKAEVLKRMTDGGAVALFEVRRQIMMNGRKKRRKAVERGFKCKETGEKAVQCLHCA